MFPAKIRNKAHAIIEVAGRRSLRVAAAESCTGGLVAAALTDVPGSSAVFERGFVTYSNEAKAELLDVPMILITQHGAVSQAVASAMARGAYTASAADLAVSITGIAGPSGGTAEKPIGLVHFAVYGIGIERHQEMHFGDLGRAAIRSASVDVALDILQEALDERDQAIKA